MGQAGAASARRSSNRWKQKSGPVEDWRLRARLTDHSLAAKRLR